jgi:acyl carrier protein
MLADEVRSTLGMQTGLEADHVIPVSRIPKTTSGKVQRSQLAAAYVEGGFDDVIAAIQPPPPEPLLGNDSSADQLITDLLRICQEVAKERAVGPDDNLFEVGVSSLTLTEIVLAIDEQYPGRLDISDLFDHSTIRDIAGFIRR